MASFNVSKNFGTFMAKQGFRVEPNKKYIPGCVSGQRSMRLFAPEALKGRAAKKWFNRVFWACHKRKHFELDDYPEIVIPTFPYSH